MRVAPLLLVFIAACAGEASPTREDAAAVDRGFVDDLKPGDASSLLDRQDGGATVDAPADVSVDRRDIGVDVRTDVPGVTIAGYFIPVDPHAVPPPGSECVGDGGVREGDPTIEPPRPIRPLSVSRVSSQRPTFQWALPVGTTGARIEVCADRCCTRVIQTFDAEGTSARPMTTLPPGVVFWRMFGRRATSVGSRASYTWEFGVRRRDAPNDTSWGTIRDFTGDGYDDAMVLASRDSSKSVFISDVFLARGSAVGLTEPSLAGIELAELPRDGTVGDLNGDGIADVVWGVQVSDTASQPAWVDVVHGTPEGLRRVVRMDGSSVDTCAALLRPMVVDWNGDGYSDIVASLVMRCNPFAPPYAAFLVAYYGSSRGIAAIPQVVIQVDRAFLHPETITLGALGDTDLDGYGDVFITSHFVGAGTAPIYAEHFVAHGSATGAPRYEGVVGPSIADDVTVIPLGDLDGDGRSDWGIRTARPALLVYRRGGMAGPTEQLRDQVTIHPDGEFWVDNGRGDINGDGLGDVIAQSGYAYDEERGDLPWERGRVFVFFGMPGGVSTVPAIALRPIRSESDEPTDRGFGMSAMSPGDYNGDGMDDLVMRDEVGNRLCFYRGRTEPSSGRPDGCFRGLWPRYDLYL